MKKFVGIEIVDEGPVVDVGDFLDSFYVSRDKAIGEVYGAGGHPAKDKIAYRCKTFDNNISSKQLHQTVLSVKCKSRTVLRKKDKKIVLFTPHNRL